MTLQGWQLSRKLLPGRQTGSAASAPHKMLAWQHITPVVTPIVHPNVQNLQRRRTRQNAEQRHRSAARRSACPWQEPQRFASAFDRRISSRQCETASPAGGRGVHLRPWSCANRDFPCCIETHIGADRRGLARRHVRCCHLLLVTAISLPPLLVQVQPAAQQQSGGGMYPPIYQSENKSAICRVPCRYLILPPSLQRKQADGCTQMSGQARILFF